MLVFIDESGDAGFKIAKGSSKNFIMVLVVFENELEVEETDLVIRKFRKRIGKSEKFEFKFNKISKRIRLKFLDCIKDCDFRILAIVILKEKMYITALRGSKDKFYYFVIKELLKKNKNTIKNAKIRIDGIGKRLFKHDLLHYLRKNLKLGTIKDLKFRDSKNNVLIQLADMIIGAISKSYDKEKTDYLDYIKIIHKKIDDIWELK